MKIIVLTKLVLGTVIINIIDNNCVKVKYALNYS